MATSNDLTTLDFDTIKENLKTFMKSQDIFQDYDFDASNINVLLDVLAYNTSLNAFYLNMISNEMFLDTAVMRDSVISHAKELNYVPRSFRSARAVVDITLTDTSPTAAIIIPRGTTVTGTSGGANFTFSIPENVQAISTDVANQFKATNVEIFEGDFTADSYVSNAINPVRYLITNKTVDTNSVRVTVIEDNGAVTLAYTKRESLFDIDSTDQVFFLQAAENDTYEVTFGDNVIGRKPKDNSIILIEYRTCNGELPNGIAKFTADGDVGSATITKIDVSTRASGGSVAESLTSIKFNAPRAFTTQERVVSASDYSTLLKTNFTEINDVIAYGGEEAVPPQFGRVIIAVDLKNTDTLPEILKDKYRQFIKPRSPLSIEPIFVKPDFTYLSINSVVKYDTTKTSLNIDDIRSLVLSSIQTFNEDNLNGFGKTLRYSKLITEIDEAQDSIVSNDTRILATKFLPFTRSRTNYALDFGFPLRNDLGRKVELHESQMISAVKSSPFLYSDEESFIEDNGNGILNIVQNEGPDQHKIVAEVGTVNYQRGTVNIENFAVQSIFGKSIKISVRPADNDVTAQRRTILRVLDEDVNIRVQQISQG